MTRRFPDSLRRGILLAAIPLLLAAAAPAQDAQPSAREVLDRFVEAVGARHLAEKTSMTTTGHFAIPAQGVQGPLTSYAKAPDEFVVTIEIPGYGTVRQGFTQGVGWSIDPATGAQILADKPLAQLRDQADYDAMLYRDEDFESLTLVGAAEFQGTPCWQIAVVSDAGLEAQHYFAKDTGLLVGMEADQHTPMGTIPSTTVIKEYQDFGGVKIAARSEQSMMGMQQVLTIESVSFEPLGDEVFALPPEIAALTAGADAE